MRNFYLVNQKGNRILKESKKEVLKNFNIYDLFHDDGKMTNIKTMREDLKIFDNIESLCLYCNNFSRFGFEDLKYAKIYISTQSTNEHLYRAIKKWDNEKQKYIIFGFIIKEYKRYNNKHKPKWESLKGINY